MRMISVLFLATAALLAGCSTQSTTCDARGGSDICEIHHLIMRSVTIKNPNMKEMPSQEYMMARSRGFIHSRPFFLPPECKRAVVFICDQCVESENTWLLQHNGRK